MKSFNKIVSDLFPRRTMITVNEASIAFDSYIKQQLIDKKDHVIPKGSRKNAYTLNNPTHRWNGQEVYSTLTRNQDGMVRISRNFKNDTVHIKFLTPVKR